MQRSTLESHGGSVQRSAVPRGSILVLFLLVLMPRTAAAEPLHPQAESLAPERPRLRLELELATDLLVSTVALGSLGGLLLDQEQQRGPNDFHPYDRSADAASDFTGAAIGSIVTGATAATLEALEQGSALEALPTVVVATEAVVLALGVTQTIKRLTGHCRPLAVAPDGSCDPAQVPDDFQPGDDRAYAAFPSGHVSSVAAVSGALGGVLFKNWLLDGRGSYLRWASFGFGTAATGATVVLRRDAGAHSLQDGLAAVAISGAVGFGVALVHPMRPVATDQPVVSSLELGWTGSQIGMSGTF